jgi:arylformamidase
MILDWDDAYTNGAYIKDGASYPARWSAEAKRFRATLEAAGCAELDVPYGEAPRERFDLFLPEGAPRGLMVFAHGGYWMAFDKSSWSHLAAGALANGWAACLPSYTLAPEARISTMARQIARAIEVAAARVPGSLRLVGHSAGGHLVMRMICEDTPAPIWLRDRIGAIVSISGLHDLRPLLNTQMNSTLRLDEHEAAQESVALRRPLPLCPVTAWVGARERPEFIRQSALIANIWTGLGMTMRRLHAPGRHHFDVIDDLADGESLLCATLFEDRERTA